MHDHARGTLSNAANKLIPVEPVYCLYPCDHAIMRCKSRVLQVQCICWSSSFIRFNAAAGHPIVRFTTYAFNSLLRVIPAMFSGVVGSNGSIREGAGNCNFPTHSSKYPTEEIFICGCTLIISIVFVRRA